MRKSFLSLSLSQSNKMFPVTSLSKIRSLRAAECGEQSAESETDPETRDSEALIKRVTGSALHRETNVMRHASCPVRISPSKQACKTARSIHTPPPFSIFFPGPSKPDERAH